LNLGGKLLTSGSPLPVTSLLLLKYDLDGAYILLVTIVMYITKLISVVPVNSNMIG